MDKRNQRQAQALFTTPNTQLESNQVHKNQLFAAYERSQEIYTLEVKIGDTILPVPLSSYSVVANHNPLGALQSYL